MIVKSATKLKMQSTEKVVSIGKINKSEEFVWKTLEMSRAKKRMK